MKSIKSPSRVVTLGALLAGLAVGAAGVVVALWQSSVPVSDVPEASLRRAGDAGVANLAKQRDARAESLHAAGLLAEFRRCGVELAGASESRRFEVVTRLRRQLLSADEESRWAVLLGYEKVPVPERSDVLRAVLRELLGTAWPRAWLEAVGAGHLEAQPLPAQWAALAALGDGDRDFARAWIEAHLAGDDRVEAFQSLALAFGRRNFGNGVALLQDSLEPSQFRKSLIRLAERVDYKGTGVAEWFATYPDVDLRLEVASWMLPRWETDEALAWIATWPMDMRVAMQDPGADRVVRDAYREVLGFLAQRDPERAWTLTASLLPVSQYNARNEILAQLMKRDPLRAVSLVTTLETEQAQIAALKQVFRNGNSANLDSATMERVFGVLLEKPALLKGAGPEVFERWTKLDPGAASTAVSRLPEQGAQAWGNILGRVAQAWARQDPEAAVRWLQTVPEGFYRRAYLATVYPAYAAKDAQAALELALRMTEPVERQNSLQAATEAWAKKDPFAAGAFALSQQSPEARTAALKGVVGAWTKSAPDAAGAWALKLADPAQRVSAIEVLTREWADLAAASRWMESLPEASAERDAAIQVLIPRVLRDDPAGAMYWALRGSTHALRAAQAHVVGSSWLEQSPAEAREWLRSREDLPAEVKAELLGPGGK